MSIERKFAMREELRGTQGFREVFLAYLPFVLIHEFGFSCPPGEYGDPWVALEEAGQALHVRDFDPLLLRPGLHLPQVSGQVLGRADESSLRRL